MLQPYEIQRKERIYLRIMHLGTYIGVALRLGQIMICEKINIGRFNHKLGLC